MKPKTLLCLALILAVALASFSMTRLISAADDSPRLSVVLSGTTSTATIAPAAVNSTFSVDVRVDNIGGVSAGVNGLSYKVRYDPTVLSVVSQGSKGPFWGSAVDDVTAILTPSSGVFIESALVVNTADPTESTHSAGVARTLTFKVISSGQCSLSIEPSDQGVAYLTSPDGYGGSIDVVATATGATYGASATPTASPTATVSPTPSSTPNGEIHGPTAVIDVANGTTYQVGDIITLSGAQSVAGYDAQNCPITNYTWVVSYSNGSVFSTFNGQTASFSVSTSTYLNATLIVTAPDQNPTPSVAYQSVSSKSIWLNVTPVSVPQIDLSTNKGGLGFNTSSGGYGPSEMVELYAKVTFNSGSVANRLVSFTVQSPNGTVIVAGQVHPTNSSGVASLEYRTPYLGETNFGVWKISATVEVSQKVATDSLSFLYSYPITTNNITVPVVVQRSSPFTVNVSVSIENVDQWHTTTFTVYDDNHVPVAAKIVPNTSQNQNQTLSVTLTIPSWAFTGTATLYINFLTADPTQNGVPICQEKTATFQIVA